jgi:hypothetical protein
MKPLSRSGSIHYIQGQARITTSNRNSDVFSASQRNDNSDTEELYQLQAPENGEFKQILTPSPPKEEFVNSIRRQRAQTAPSQKREEIRRITEETKPKIRKHGSIRGSISIPSPSESLRQSLSSSRELASPMSGSSAIGSKPPLPPIQSLRDHRRYLISSAPVRLAVSTEKDSTTRREELNKLREQGLAAVRRSFSASKEAGLVFNGSKTSMVSIEEEAPAQPIFDRRQPLPPIPRNRLHSTSVQEQI